MKNLCWIISATLMVGLSPLRAEFDVESAEESTFRIIKVSIDSAGNLSLGSGSGFLLNNQGYLATNVHVIDGPGTLFVLQARGNQIHFWEANAYSQHPGKDLAILRVPGLSGRPVVFPSAEPKKATAVYAVGYPGQADDAAQRWSFVEALLEQYRKKEANSIPMDPAYSDYVNTSIKQGFIESLRSRDWGYPTSNARCRVIFHSTPITGGNSGGPLFNKEGQVVGVNTRGQGEAKVDGVLLGNVIAQSSIYTELVHILESESINYTSANEAVPAPQPSIPLPDPPTSAANADEPHPQHEPAPGPTQLENKPQPEQLSAIFTFFNGSATNAWIASTLIFLGIGVAGVAIFLVVRNPRSAALPVSSRPVAAPLASALPPPEAHRITPVMQQDETACRLAGTDSRGAPILLEIRDRELSNPEGCTIGRGSDAVCRINDDSISRIHIKIKWSRKGLYVSDAGSSNGSTINGKPLKPKLGVILQVGDRIALGNVNLVVKSIKALQNP